MRTGQIKSQTMLNISEAKAQLSSVIEQVVNEGKEFIIGKAGKPVAKVVRYEPAKRHRRLGLFEGQIDVAQDFDQWPADVAKFLGMDES